MKPLHVGVLLVAGAFGGAVIMKVAFQPQTVAPAAVVAQVQAPPGAVGAEVRAPRAPAPATPPAEPADARATGVPDKPSPVEAVKAVHEAPKPLRSHRAAVTRPPAEVEPPSRPGAPAEPMPVAPTSPAAPAPAPAPAEPEATSPARV